MIGKQAFDRLTEDEQKVVGECLRVLANLQIFLIQIEEMQRQLMVGFDEKKPEILANEIVEIKLQSKVLRGLHDLGLRYKEGM